MRDGHTVLTDILSADQLSTITEAAVALDDVRLGKQSEKGTVHTYTYANSTGLPATIMDTALYKTQLFDFLDALLRNGVQTARRFRKEDGSVQAAFRPAGWTNNTTNDGWKGHFDKTGCGFSMLVGVCLKSPTV